MNDRPAARADTHQAARLSGDWPGRAEVMLAAGAAASVVATHPAVPAAVTKQLGLLLVGLVGLGLTVPRQLRVRAARRWSLPSPVLAWLLLCGFTGLSCSWASHGSSPLLATWLAAAALAVTASTLEPAGVRRVGRLCATLIGGGSAVIGIVQALAGARGLELHGGQGNANWLGLVLACSLPLQVDHALHARRAGSRLWWIPAGATVLAAVALLLSASRVAWLAMVVVGLVFAVKRWRLVGLAGAAALTAWALCSDDLIGAWHGRVWIWQVSMDAALRNLPWGTGHGDFAAAFLDAQGELLWKLDVRSAALRFENATTAHNDWLEALVTGGPLALAALTATMAMAIAALRRRWPAGAACAAAVGLCALGDSPLHQPAAVALLALVCAAAPHRSTGRPLMLLHAALLASVILVLPRAATRALGHRALSRARTAHFTERLTLLDEARLIDPRSGEAHLELGLAQLALGRAARALPHLERSRQLLTNLGTDVAIGNAELRLERLSRAVTAYRRATQRHPGYFRAHANLVEAYRRLGRLDAADRHLAIARQLQPGHPKLARIAERLRRTRIEAETNR